MGLRRIFSSREGAFMAILSCFPWPKLMMRGTVGGAKLVTGAEAVGGASGLSARLMPDGVDD